MVSHVDIASFIYVAMLTNAGKRLLPSYNQAAPTITNKINRTTINANPPW